MRSFLGSVMVLVSPALVAATIKAMSSFTASTLYIRKLETLEKMVKVYREVKELYTLLRQIKKDKIIIIVSHDDEITQVVNHVITVHK